MESTRKAFPFLCADLHRLRCPRVIIHPMHLKRVHVHGMIVIGVNELIRNREKLQ